MKSKLIFLCTWLVCSVAFAATNVLILTWEQPAGFKGTLYRADNINGEWTAFSESPPPVEVEPTNCMAFFRVEITSTNLINPIVIHDLDPNLENLKPLYTNQPAFSYSSNTVSFLYTWNMGGYWQ